MGEAGDSYSAANSPYSPCLSSLRLLALLLLSEVGCDISWLAAVPTGVRRSECCPSIGQSLTPCFEKQTRVVLRSNLSPCFCVVHLVPRRGLGGGGISATRQSVCGMPHARSGWGKEERRRAGLLALLWCAWVPR